MQGPSSSCRAVPVLLAGALTLGCWSSVSTAQPLTTAFTYQGELQSGGTPATGLHDLRFRLFDASAGGAQVGSTICVNNVDVAGGRFAAELDFGAVFAGEQRFLAIDVRADTGLNCSSGAGFVTLAPRQALTGAPNALFALNADEAAHAIAADTATSATTATTAATATNSTQLNGQGAAFYQNAGNLSSGTLASARLSGAYSNILTLSNPGNLFTGVFTGSGADLTALNASNLASGTLADTRLSNNVALLNTAQTFSAGKTFSAAPSFTGAGSPFSVTATGLVTNLNADRLDGLDSTVFLQSIPVPLELSTTFDLRVIRCVQNSQSIPRYAVEGVDLGASGLSYGVAGFTSSTSGTGVFGHAAAGTGMTLGVFGLSDSTSGRGAFGYATAGNGITYGVYGQSGSTDGRGVYGLATANSGFTYGVLGQSGSTDGRGVYGEATAATGTTYGVWGQSHSTSGRGVFGWANAASGANYGVLGQSSSTAGYGVYGQATATSGVAIGVVGQSASTSGAGVSGYASATSGFNYGGNFQSDSTSGRGVYALATAATGGTYGVWGQSASTSGYGVFGQATATSGITFAGRFECSSANGLGVFGWATAATGSTYGMYGQSDSTSGRGVFGIATAASGTIYGVYGQASTAAGGYAVFAAGDMGASGLKPFRIDHPDDPANKYLLHYAAESPEVINFYSGKATLDGAGEAVVELPRYFAKINKDPRYTLTAIGAPMPMLHVAEEIDEAALSAGAKAEPGEAAPVCTFRIAGGEPDAKVSWRVEAVRNDRWVQQRGAPVEVEKQDLEKGTYQHPELYGQPPEKGMNYDATRPRPEPVRPDPARPAPIAAKLR